MDKLASKTASELDILYGLYKLALEYTLKINPENEKELAKWLDTRQRILGKTDVASKSAAKLLAQVKLQKTITPSEQALIAEKKSLIEDLFTTLRKKEFDLLNQLHYRKSKVRTELANLSRKQVASSAYTNAPRPKLMVA